MLLANNSSSLNQLLLIKVTNFVMLKLSILVISRINNLIRSTVEIDAFNYGETLYSMTWKLEYKLRTHNFIQGKYN